MCFHLLDGFPSSFQVSGRKCHRSIQTSSSSGILLTGGFVASYNAQHVGRHFLITVLWYKILPLMFPWARCARVCHHSIYPSCSEVCVVQTGVLFLSLTCSGRGDSSIYNKCYLQHLKEWISWCAPKGVPNDAFAAPKLAHFLDYLFRVDWPGMQLVYIILLF